MMTNRFTQSAQIILYIVAGMLPLWFLPAPFGAEGAREIAWTALAAAAASAWLVSALAAGEARYPVSPVLVAVGILAAVWITSTLVSPAPSVSAFFADAGAERALTLATGLALMIVTAGVLQSRGAETHGSAGTLLFVLVFSGAVAALLSLYTFLAGPIPFLSPQPYFNVIGTINGMALFYASLFMMTAGLLVSHAVDGWKAWVRWALIASAALFLVNLLLINFRTAWIVLLGAGVCLFGLLLTNISTYRNVEMSRRFGWRQWSGLALVIFSIVMIMAPAASPVSLDVPAEVSPSFTATLAMGGSVFREGPLRVFLGSGPGSFGLVWARYKDASINQTVFWNVRFNQGQSWVATALPTMGILGFVTLIGFLAVMLFTFLRMMLAYPLPELRSGVARAGHDAEIALSAAGQLSNGSATAAGNAGTGTADPLVMSAFLGAVPLIIAAFLYPANTSLMMLFFLLAGALISLLAVPLPALSGVAPMRDGVSHRVERAEPEGQDFENNRENREDDEDDDMEAKPPVGGFASDAAAAPAVSPRGFWDIRVRRLLFATPWSVFASSLAIIFFIALAIAALYGTAARARAAWAASRGVAAFGEGKTDEAIFQMEQALRAEPRNFRNAQLLTQARAEKVRGVIQRAARGEAVQAEFQSAVSLATQASQRMIAMHPGEPALWRIQGGLYEMVIPFVQGSERLAVAAYQRATELEPQNPAGYVDWGRAGLVFTDRLAALAQQAQGKDREDVAKARQQNLEQIVTIFQRAIQAKQDYAPAHFLLAQTAIRLGNLDAAILSVENAKLTAPFDIGVAFQLGLLYYQKENFDRAQLEFERAVAVNENYANARYFLGLIYDRKGDKEKAKAEFAKIAALNPDNPEVKRILENLSSGKPALDGIVPPAPPPEDRRETPVKEFEGKK